MLVLTTAFEGDKTCKKVFLQAADAGVFVLALRPPSSPLPEAPWLATALTVSFAPPCSRIF